MRTLSLPAWLQSDLLWAFVIVAGGFGLGLVVNAYSSHGINMSLAMDWWPFGG